MVTTTENHSSRRNIYWAGGQLGGRWIALVDRSPSMRYRFLLWSSAPLGEVKNRSVRHSGIRLEFQNLEGGSREAAVNLRPACLQSKSPSQKQNKKRNTLGLTSAAVNTHYNFLLNYFGCM